VILPPWKSILVGSVWYISTRELWQGGKKSLMFEGRALVCFWATKELGMTATSVGSRLKISQTTDCRAAQRGRQLTAEKGWILAHRVDFSFF